MKFFKYQATGNDFILVDNRQRQYSFSSKEIAKMCDRKFGIGADGFMLIEPHETLDFNLVYYNSDGSQSLCGNGSRAAVSFASRLGMIDKETSFNAYDGAHDAELLASGTVRLKMNDVWAITPIGDDYFINTGSPHYLKFVNNLEQYAVYEEGRAIRFSKQFEPEGTNVNFIEKVDATTIGVRTYERGVENETLSCGTGVTAAALAASISGYRSPVSIKTRGGNLHIEFSYDEQTKRFYNIYLVGPAELVFEGEWPTRQ